MSSGTSWKMAEINGITVCLLILIYIFWHKWEPLIQSRSSDVSDSRLERHRLVKRSYKSEANAEIDTPNVNTLTCYIPSINPFSKEAIKVFKRRIETCSHQVPLVSVTYDTQSRHYTLHVMQNQSDNAKDSVECCYKEVIRSSGDQGVKLLPCANFLQGTIVPRHIEAILVTCRSQKTHAVLQEDGFTFVQAKEVKPFPKKQVTLQKISVILIGIDSMSRANFLRNMPLTHRYLQQKKWFDLKGYHRMYDNTYPNLMAMLTGYNSTEIYRTCNPRVDGGLEVPKCKFMWQRYKAQGYRTAYVEGFVDFSTFNYLKRGFKKQPTDHYFRPAAIAFEKKLKISHNRFCLGHRIYGKYIFDYAQQFAEVYANESVFGIFWANTFSHDNFQLPHSMDSHMVEYFKRFETNGLMERAVLIFVSDHGMRFGPLRHLSTGFLEASLPMFFMSLPQPFQATHKKFVQALRINRHRLVTPFDIYKTLNHILELDNTSLKLPEPQGCSACQSIFYEMPMKRTCADGGITSEWCACRFLKNQSHETPQGSDIATLVISKVNDYMVEQKLTHKCETLKLDSIKEATQQEPINSTVTVHRVRFQVMPKKLTYEATVHYNAVTRAIHVNLDAISILDSYHDISTCVDILVVKQICICKPKKNARRKRRRSHKKIVHPIKRLSTKVPEVFSSK